MILPALLLGTAVLVLTGMPSPSRLAALSARAPLVVDVRIPALAGVVVLSVVLGPVGAAVAVGLGAVGVRVWRRRQRAQAVELQRGSAVEALTVLASELRAGRQSADALEGAASVALGSLAEVLRSASASQRFGADASTALLAAADTTATPEVLRGLAACWQVCSSTGSSLAVAVDQLGESLRAEREQRRAVEAELAGPRASAALLACLPALGMALAAGLGARPLHVLLHTPAGIACLLVGVGLDLLGLWWTGRLVEHAC